MLIAAARAGRWFDGAAGNGCAEIDAAVLRGLCCDQRDDVDAAGIRLRNVHIRESLDLAGVEVPFPLRLDGCRFDGPLQLDGARLHRLDLTNCPDVPGVVANGLEVRRDLNLSGSTITAAHATTASESRTATVWLCESHIGGSLFLVDSQDGRRPTVRGGMDMTGARVAAQVVVRNATIARPSTSPGGGSAPRRARETAIRAAGRRSLHRPRPSTATRTSGREPQLPWPLVDVVPQQGVAVGRRDGPVAQPVDPAGLGAVVDLPGLVHAARAERMSSGQMTCRTSPVGRNSTPRRGVENSDMSDTSFPVSTCINCGDELPAERAELGYRYCTKGSCQARYHRGLAVTTVGVNKSADAVIVADPDEIRRRGEVGEFAKKDTGIGLDYRSPTGARTERRARAAPSHPTQPPPRRPWTPQQEKIVRLYHDMGLSPRQIVARARENAPRLQLTEPLVVKILSSLPQRQGRRPGRGR